MRLILPIVLALAGTGAGVAAGHMLKPEAASPKAGDTREAGPADRETAKDGQDHAGQGEPDAGSSHDDAVGAAQRGSDTEFVKLSNQFVVPVLQDGRVKSMVVLSLTLETTIGAKEDVYAQEPKIRDGFLQVLFDYANAGGFDGTFTSGHALDSLRLALREAGMRIVGAPMMDVLVTDIARQDF